MFKNPLLPLCVVSAFLALSAFLCQANDGTSLTINGNETINQIGTAHYSASANNGEVTNCRWSTSDLNFSGPGPFVTPDENQCEITYRSFGSLILKCDADVILNGTIKPVSSSKNISCQQPATNTVVTLSINGPGEVTINSTKTYSANYTGYDGVPTISWRYIGGTPTGNSINIHFVTNITHHLECTLRYKDANSNNQEVTAEMYIKVLPQVELSALRADYKDYTSAVISGTNLVYIHFNIDDDDISYDNNDKRGTDCKQKEFADGKVDDDLCKIEISLGDNIDLEDITDGTLFFEVPVGLRLWTSSSRTNIFIENDNKKPLKRGYSFGNNTERPQLISILTDGFYVEGVCPGSHNLIISFGSNELNLPYFCCSVGGIDDQPEGSLRTKYTSKFSGLVGCEWCVQEITNNFHPKKFNCIAYSVDPNLVVFNKQNLINPFNGAFWVNPIYLGIDYDFQLYTTNNVEPHFINFKIPANKWNLLDLIVQIGLENNYPKQLNGDFYEFAGYDNCFKTQVKETINTLGRGALTFEDYSITMNLFNTGDKNTFTFADVDCFFTSPLWTEANSHKLNGCDTNDNNRIITYYNGIGTNGYHAARKITHQQIIENKAYDWHIVASKDGKEKELLIHLEDQISNKYGKPTKAYK
ncbi:hypothetical protein J6X96_06900 [bacterium]|nr:hypothetical protein [bacterium]